MPHPFHPKRTLLPNANQKVTQTAHGSLRPLARSFEVVALS